MEHEDLRVIKTVECIETAYLELLQQKDADKNIAHQPSQ